MRKVFQAETRNKGGFAAGLLGGLAISLLLFLILPFTQKLTGSNPKNLLLNDLSFLLEGQLRYRK